MVNAHGQPTTIVVTSLVMLQCSKIVFFLAFFLMEDLEHLFFTHLHQTVSFATKKCQNA